MYCKLKQIKLNEGANNGINSSKVYCKYDKIILKHSTITVLIVAKCIVNWSRGGRRYCLNWY